MNPRVRALALAAAFIVSVLPACAGSREEQRAGAPAPAWVSRPPDEGAVGMCEWTPLGAARQREIAQERATVALARARVGARVHVEETLERHANNQRDSSTLDSTQKVEVNAHAIKASVRDEWVNPDNAAYWVWMVAAD